MSISVNILFFVVPKNYKSIGYAMFRVPISDEKERHRQALI